MAIQFPSYQKVNYDSLISISEVREQLEENTQLIEFFWGDSLFQTLSISKEETQLSTFKITEEFKGMVLLLQNLISNPDLNRNQQNLFEEYSILSHEVYQALLGDLIGEKIEKIIISPDGPLSLIPFEALSVSVKGSDFRNADYLLQNTDIQYVYSTNLWLKNLAAEAIKNPKILAFAYSNGDAITSESRRSLNEIPASAEEVTTIKNIFRKNADILYGEEATETAFKELAFDYNILHLAVHGIGDTVNSNNSRLIFKVSTDSIDDGNLYAHELYTIELRLAVLSACESGIGKEFPGEGIFSMARGFTYTGCPTTIMSLWKVSDALTASIMGLFYENLNNGLSTSQSLRMAKLEYLRESKSVNAHPSYWAALVQLGDSKPVVVAQNVFIKYLIWVAPFLVIIFWYVRRRNR